MPGDDERHRPGFPGRDRQAPRQPPDQGSIQRRARPVDRPIGRAVLITLGGGGQAVAGAAEGSIRRSLTDYSTSYLRFVWTLSATATAVAYSLWAFEISAGATSWATLSIAPFLLALLRYAVDVDGGEAGAPEDIVSGDRVLQVLGLLWLAFLCLAVYL